MAIYDVIIGQKIAAHHCNILYFSREDIDDSSKANLYRKLYEAMNVSLQSTVEIPNREDINQALSYCSESLYPVQGAAVTDNNIQDASECFDVISYFGVEAYCLRRDDIATAEADDRSVRAYLINGKMEGADTRVSPALGISSTDITLGSTSDIVMETFRSKIRLEPRLESLINLSAQIRDWEILSEVGAGYEFDSSSLLTLLENMGYTVRIFLSGR